MTTEIKINRKTRWAWAVASWTTALAILASASTIAYYREQTELAQKLEELAATRLAKEQIAGLHAEAAAELVAARALSEGMAALFESANFGFLVVDSHGSIRSWNPAIEALTGRNARELLGANVAELMPAEFRQTHDERFRAAMADPGKYGKVLAINCEVLRPGRTPIPVRVRAYIVNSKSGPIGVALLVRDRDVILVDPPREEATARE